MLSLDEVRKLVAEKVQPRDPAGASLHEALGRVLRMDVRAPADIPAFDRSAMDGYAIPAGDTGERFKIIGEVRPGLPTALRIGPGECARILTGGAVPPGAGQVLKQEDVRIADGWIQLRAERLEEVYIRFRGEDARQGDLLLRSGTRLGAAEVSLLASLGITEPLVSPRIRVVHFATGDELVDAAQEPAEGQIRDSNSVLVHAFLQSQGAAVLRQERLPDDAGLLFEKCADAHALDSSCDLLLISGGSSVGNYDFALPVLERLGFEIHFSKMNLRPGKPLIFATRGGQVAFGLPGNPVSHFVVLHAVVTAALNRLAGLEPALRMVSAPLGAGFHTRGDGRDTLWPARVAFAPEGLSVEAARWQSSGDLAGLAGVNALIRCPAPVLDTGACVPCILLHV